MAILLIWECNHCLRNWAQTRSEHVSIRLISRDKVGDAPQSHFEWSDNRSHCNWRQPVAQPMGSQLNSQAMSANFAARSRPGGVSSRPRARFNFLLLNLIRPFSQKNTGNRWKQQTCKHLKDAERAKRVAFLLCAERAGGARWQEGKKVDKRMRLLSSQSAARRQCHGCTSQFVHICPKSSNGSCAADLLVEN